MFRSGLRITTCTQRVLYNAGYYQSNLPQSFIKSFAINTRYFTSSQPMRSSAIYGSTPITGKDSNVLNQIPEELLLYTHHPKPVRHEILESNAPLKTKDLENLDVKVGLHREPVTWSDKLAFKIVKLLRVPSDWFFKKKYVHRAVMLETVAAVPGMVGGTIRHLRSLRKLQHDGGWIDHLLHEAENERMHLMTWMRISKPKMWERGLITIVQGVFYNAFFALYLLSPKTAHRVVGYLEEEAIVSYTSFLKEIENGHIENTKNIPDLAIDYWHLDKDTATLKDLVLAVRADEATHRDTNHHFADRIILGNEDLRDDIKRIFDKSESKKVKKIAGLSQDASEKWKWNH
ncbi:4078_t:CDS:2 [Funneliformis mosseae]|uniref:Alternative oxidase n=1 Tax=Funneliformis mosseae TaxID=27381 RepID=A0A9N8WM07_FUNMO|nr:4078_t:CDS:2 [Funneliformis mosseae]